MLTCAGSRAVRLNEFLFSCRRNRAPPLTLTIFYREDNWKFIFFFNHQKPVIKIGKRNGKIAFSHRWLVLGVPFCASKSLPLCSKLNGPIYY